MNLGLSNFFQVLFWDMFLSKQKCKGVLCGKSLAPALKMFSRKKHILHMVSKNFMHYDFVDILLRRKSIDNLLWS